MRPPDGTVRRSQIITTAGPGALVDLIKDAVIIGGLDTWRYSSDQEGLIVEPRLQAKAQKLLTAMPWWGHPDVRLRAPPACDDSKATPGRGIQAARFPGWYLCQNNSCRSLVNWRGLNEQRKHICSDTVSRRGMPVVPVRFVSACPNGHIQDIYWQWFVHRGQSEDGVVQEQGQMRRYCTRKGASQRPNDPLGDGYASPLYLIQVGTSGELADYVVGCRDCGKVRGLQELNTPASLGSCPGQRPWLGDAREADCSQKTQLRLLTRTASNAYFAQTLSVLSIPDPDVEIRESVEKVWDILKVATPQSLPAFLTIPMVHKALGSCPSSVVWEEIERRQQGRPVPIPKTRETEWRALMAAPMEAPGERPDPEQVWFARQIPTPDAPDFLDRVVLVHHLREVRAQIGFTRLESVTGDAEGDYDLAVTTAPLGLDVDWIPAVEILGEGVFIAFDRDAIERWESRKAVIERREKLSAALRKFNENRKNPVLFPQTVAARLLMLHTLAHMLINAISLECGYPATSIRERIYCSHSSDGSGWRAGILLYTGTPGSEGTLGGLVEIGRSILHHLRRAAEMGLLCSNDPVCAQHEPHGDEEGREREGAACHGCVLIGEPSCERMNRDLDRTFVVPTVQEEEVAFLRDWVRAWSG